MNQQKEWWERKESEIEGTLVIIFDEICSKLLKLL
jgi:hypothetical protein